MQKERPRDLIPEVRKYISKRIGGSEVIRTLRDTLDVLGVKPKKKSTTYKHRKVLAERESKAFDERRESLRDQGVIIKKRRNAKEEMRKKKKW
ncbi:hypothetical protein NEDG_01560 [Nematocida displodere]|uniref:Uncharacterized protein n=1 Tax=Nematocida displodere TaxID=1805483 RepID=A0A177EDH2_9MICR|nr:hypothetical protein NEDG_01560 [Nematocida displodere]